MIPRRPVPARPASLRPRPPRAARFRRRVAGAALIAATGVVLTATPSAQANLIAEGSDPANDAATPHGGHDITRVSMAHNPRTGDLRAQIRFRGEPDGSFPANVNIFAGRRTATGCNGYPAIGFGTLDTARGADAVMLPSAGAAPVTRSASKKGGGTATQEFEAKDALFRGPTPNCVVATTSDPTNPQIVWDQAGPFTLRRVPVLEAQIRSVPSSMRPGQQRTVRVTLRNTGQARTGRVRISIPRTKGMTLSYSRSVASIAAGRSRTINVRVTLSRSASLRPRMRVNATAPNKLRARDEAQLRLIKPSAGGGGGGGGGNPTKLCYRYTWLPPYGELVPC